MQPTNTSTQMIMTKRGAEDSGRYFKYMADFVGLTPSDIETIKQTGPIVEKHLPEIVSKFYGHLLRYPPTRKFFLKKDSSIDQEYVELRMRHLTNFWIRTAQGEYDDDYARYIDYVGRAHTSHGADPHIYIAERYVIGQVGFVQHAITEVLMKELRNQDEDLEDRAIDAWDKLLMVILEMLSRAYGSERETETFDALVSVDQTAVGKLAARAFTLERDKDKTVAVKPAKVARVQEIPEGERKIVEVDGLSIGVFHHQGNFYAVRNWCLHRGGPVATGCLEGNTLECPWHGFQYDITSGQLLVDPSACLTTYGVVVQNDDIFVEVPITPAPIAPTARVKENEFRASELAPGQSRLVHVDGAAVAVYNVGGTFFATQDECTHASGSLSEGMLDGNVIICPIHGSCFDVTNGRVTMGPATKPLTTWRVTLDGEIARVEKMAE